MIETESETYKFKCTGIMQENLSSLYSSEKLTKSQFDESCQEQEEDN